MEYEELVRRALAEPFAGWDFGVLAGRMTAREELPWDYARLVRDRLPGAASLLDLGTGGGELLASLAPLPPRTAATEGYPPNVAIARRRLARLGVEVVAGGPAPLPGGAFELVTARHEAYDPGEIRRLLAPGGVFVTQQVAGRDLEEVNAALGAPPHERRDWDLAQAAAGLAAAGLEVTWTGEGGYPAVFHDVGALVLFLRVVPWQVPGFTVAGYDGRLRALHAELRRGRSLRATARRFALVARLP
ncbi:class I SAM-dependent methyltransferase [Actinomadura sp. ATCC 31491]|uniref:Class I SAM-dependent methyltransferase n=1 Tax=Actinomadura luzonensis TaxID=2805427 RepID=A0ABT0G6A9_9ACTN|nr:class I SAM-dependent methyltransferase [Actinomadura luzonensis]MCK2220151.1 class I SAM-dependent methyltransferase [Actinomadura luzonensis]